MSISGEMFGKGNGKRLTGNHIVSEKNIITKNRNERRLTANGSPTAMLVNL